MSVLLSIDLLGARAHLKRADPHAAAAISEDFGDLVIDTAESLDAASELTGSISNDSCVLQCPTVKTALALSRRIFRRAWLETRTPNDMRLWLRGAIMNGRVDTAASEAPASECLPGIRKHVPIPSVRKIHSILRSGYRGMRILIDEELLDDQLRGVFRIPLGRLGVIPFRRMNFTPYPRRLDSRFQDFLWMADNEPEWAQYGMRMKQRMMWSVDDHSEFVQAAATQVVFHECDAILQSVNRKNQMRRDERAPQVTPHSRPRSTTHSNELTEGSAGA